MAYNAFTNGKPIGTDTGPDAIDYIRNNEMALRDAITIGAMKGWNYSKTDGTGSAEQPQYVYYKNGTEWLRGTLTWGTTGGESGNVTVAVWAYSSNSGGAWDTIGTETITYDSSGNVTATTWS
jgi:hypothetical protein